MLSSDPIDLGDAATSEAKAYLRVAGSDEDALIGRLMRSAAEHCEQFTSQVLVARGFSEPLPARPAWTRVGRSAVRAITLVEGLPAQGQPFALGADSFSVDIDMRGDGWLRIAAAAGVPRVRVAYEAGLALSWEEVPEALRQGVIRLAAHFYAHREAAQPAAASGPPAAVTALWRPWRRLRIAG